MLHSRWLQSLLAPACFFLVASVLLGSDDLDNYVFMPDADQLVEVCYGPTAAIGKLDAAGNFLPTQINLRKGQSHSAVTNIKMLNPKAEKNVYEFRSGRLIKGELNQNGYFVPEIGSKVIDFKDYHYREGGPRIWNLPGRFEKKTRTS